MGSNKILNENFFSEQSEASKIKSKIVSKYLDGWSLIIGSWAHKIVYADFFAGCGRYEDGNPSTPLEAISNIAVRDKLRGKIQMIFNEFNGEFYKQLQDNVIKYQDTKLLFYKPIIQNQDFQDLPALVQLRNWLELSPGVNIPPSLVFVDPWGYKGLSLYHLGDILKIKGCEVIFFFNYNRINSALSNAFMKKHMALLFGQEKAELLRKELALIRDKPTAREAVIIKAVKEILQTHVNPQRAYIQEFKFKKGNRVSHFVIFATTHPKGFGLMKDIMALESASYFDGLPTYQYSQSKSIQMSLFGGLVPLAEQLLKFFAGQTVSSLDVYEKHQVTGPYTSRNYKDVLLWLEEHQQVIVAPERSKRKLYKGGPTMGEKVMISFP